MTHHFTCPPLTTFLKSCKTLTDFKQIHVHIIQNGLQNDNYIITNFISHFFDNFNINNNKKISFDYPTSVFNAVVYPNDRLCNAFLKGCFEYSSLSFSLSVLSGLRVSGFCPDCRELGCCVGFGVHGLLIKYGIDDDLFVGSSLVDFYGKCRLLGDAQKVFDEMPVRNEVSWTTLVMAYANDGELGSARRVFDEMPKRNQVSWNVMISGYVKKGELDEAKTLFDEMPCKNVVTFTTMVDGYAKSGDMASAEVLFNQCREKDCFLWSALVSGYVQNRQPDEAVRCFRKMRGSKTRPDEFIMVSVMSACAQLENLNLARELDSYVMNCSSFDRCRPHVVAALVDMNAKCGNIERAMYLFENMPKRDLISYCSMIQGCSIHGQGTNAVQLFYDMISEGIVPDNVAFTVVLTACSRSRLVEEGYRLFDMMKNNYLISPSADHYACMVDLLGRSGHLKAAYNILKSMPDGFHPEAWGALLGACRLHCNSELGELVARHLVEVEPYNGGNFVSLSKVDAKADRWVDVSNVRDLPTS
ncbi:putative pentatricopeptide repeat-containing protein At5g37570 [Silene latifolia]|uniref:putative pentatricopeptide repeat-containing protein At5g37570 n=1 Tax=Silene latifolia TaxID=37657 RepID=UPI003D783175